jgi:hypothetical protein
LQGHFVVLPIIFLFVLIFVLVFFPLLFLLFLLFVVLRITRGFQSRARDRAVDSRERALAAGQPQARRHLTV